MSVEVEGIEETSTSTRVTRRTSLINQICTQIDDLLRERGQKDEDIIKISLDLDMSKIDEHVLEAIHQKYDVEIIGNDIFIKCDGLLKGQVHAALLVSAMVHNQNWIVVTNGICVVAGNQYRPDLGMWFQKPSRLQQLNPIVGRCPPPNVWGEVFYDRDPDRSNALSKIALVHQRRPRIEFVGVALSDNPNPFHRNPNPQVAPTAAIQHNGVPKAPYLIHWDVNFNPVYYRMDWNLHVVLRCGWTILFDRILIKNL